MLFRLTTPLQPKQNWGLSLTPPEGGLSVIDTEAGTLTGRRHKDILGRDAVDGTYAGDSNNSPGADSLDVTTRGGRADKFDARKSSALITDTNGADTTIVTFPGVEAIRPKGNFADLGISLDQIATKDAAALY